MEEEQEIYQRFMTNFCIIIKDGRLDVVANDAGDRTTPACVGINEGEILVGLSAKQLYGRKPTAVVRHNKKILSLNESDVSIVRDNYPFKTQNEIAQG